MRILYFAWLKDKIGTSAEDLPLPGGVADVEGLIAWLKARGGGYADAFADPNLVRIAVNHEYVQLDHEVADGDEVAFFPPVTGG